MMNKHGNVLKCGNFNLLIRWADRWDDLPHRLVF